MTTTRRLLTFFGHCNPEPLNESRVLALDSGIDVYACPFDSQLPSMINYLHHMPVVCVCCNNVFSLADIEKSAIPVPFDDTSGHYNLQPALVDKLLTSGHRTFHMCKNCSRYRGNSVEMNDFDWSFLKLMDNIGKMKRTVDIVNSIIDLSIAIMRGSFKFLDNNTNARKIRTLRVVIHLAQPINLVQDYGLELMNCYEFDLNKSYKLFSCRYLTSTLIEQNHHILEVKIGSYCPICTNVIGRCFHAGVECDVRSAIHSDCGLAYSFVPMVSLFSERGTSNNFYLEVFLMYPMIMSTVSYSKLMVENPVVSSMVAEVEDIIDKLSDAGYPLHVPNTYVMPVPAPKGLICFNPAHHTYKVPTFILINAHSICPKIIENIGYTNCIYRPIEKKELVEKLRLFLNAL